MSDAFGGPTANGIDDVDRAVEGIKANWVAMKEYGAVNTRCTVTGGKLLEPCRSGQARKRWTITSIKLER